jgi:nucleoside-diphosphate-sugar epimerase
VRRYGIAPNEVTFQTNVMGTFNVHEAAYQLGVRRVVTTGSQAILGWDYRERDFPPAYLPVDEDHPIQPQDAYGLSKEVVESLARAYARKGQETLVLRPNAVVTPEELAAFRAQGGRRPARFLLYSYVDARDAASAYRLAIERPIEPGSALFVVADDTSVAEPLRTLLPRLLPLVGDAAARLGDTQPAISNARARAMLGWAPRYTWRAPEPA